MLKSFFGKRKAETCDELNNPLFGPNHSYSRFLIYTHARSGSSLLVRLLASHPNAVCFGELFVSNRIGFGYEGFNNNSQALLELRDTNPLKFLSNFVYTSYTKETNAVGFKLFPEQLESNHQQVKEWLSVNHGIKIIVLNRSNYLAALASKKLAAETGKWGITDSSERNTNTITLTELECKNFFEMRASYFEASKEIFRGFDVLELDYEDLNAALDNTLEKTQSFLGLTKCKLSTSKVKQEIRPLNQVIENYDELRTKFRSSAFAHLFP